MSRIKADASLIKTSRATSSTTAPSLFEIHANVSKNTRVDDENENKEIFVERTNLLTSPFEYRRNGTDPGLVLIFNQENFESEQRTREGTRRDVNEIITTMSRLGFNMNKDRVYQDKTRKEILEVIQEICKLENLSHVNSLIVFFLTHGENLNQVHASDTFLSTDDLWKEFCKCSKLDGKPKMFIFQACKGENHSNISEHATNDIDLVTSNTFESSYLSPDMLVVYSATEGNASFRDSRTGSWFIQELCKNFASYGRRDDVLSLITRTTKCMCRNYYFADDSKLKKQIPVYISTLRKKFYLNRSKDRDVILHCVNEQTKMREKINELEKKVNELIKNKR